MLIILCTVVRCVVQNRKIHFTKETSIQVFFLLFNIVIDYLHHLFVNFMKLFNHTIIIYAFIYMCYQLFEKM